MQKHEYFKQLCALRGTGELSPEEEADVREHLTECETCREAQEAFDKASKLQARPCSR